MIFQSDKHKEAYNKILKDMGDTANKDVYRMSVAYLFALDEVCYQHINDLYDFDERHIILEGIHKAWQTGTTRKTTRLAFNLWNGRFEDIPREDADGEQATTASGYTPYEIFCCSYAPFYYEAIKIRYPEYAGDK